MSWCMVSNVVAGTVKSVCNDYPGCGLSRQVVMTDSLSLRRISHGEVRHLAKSGDTIPCQSHCHWCSHSCRYGAKVTSSA